jgi:hypothetical protein
MPSEDASVLAALTNPIQAACLRWFPLATGVEDVQAWPAVVRRFQMSCVFIPVKSNRFQKGDIVRFPFGEAGGRAEGTVIATGVTFGVRRKVRIETVAAQFEIDETDVQLVSRSSSGQA